MTVFFGTGCLHLDVGQGEGVVVHFDTKKTWISTVVVPRPEALALPNVLEQQREAHAEMYVYLYTFIRRIYASI